MSGDPEISAWLINLINKRNAGEPDTQPKSDDFLPVIEMDDDYPDLEVGDNIYDDNDNFDFKRKDKNDDRKDINNEFIFENDFEPNDENDTLNEARRLLSSWADQTEHFKKPSQPKKPPPFANRDLGKNGNMNSKVVQYRKLEMPMMVAKKAPALQVNDPTQNMEDRLKHVREMKEKRLAKMNQNQIKSDLNSNANVKRQQKQAPAVQVPDIDAEIKSYRTKLNEKLKVKQKEIENRETKLKEIEENAFENVNKEIEEENEKYYNQIETQKRKRISMNNGSYNNDNENNNFNENKRTPNKMNNYNNLKDKNDIRTQKNTNNNQTNSLTGNGGKERRKKEKEIREKEMRDNELMEKEKEQSLQLRLQIFLKNEIVRKRRFFFSIWSKKCHFHSQAFRKAAVIADFRMLSKSFSFWRQRLKDLIQNRDIEQLERNLRERKKKENQINQNYKKKYLMKYLALWKLKYRTKIEYQIADARKRKRLELVVTKIQPQQIQNQQIQNQQRQKNQNKRGIIVTKKSHANINRNNNNNSNNNSNDINNMIVCNVSHSQQNVQFGPNSPNADFESLNNGTESPSSSVNNSPNKKTKKIKIDPKIAAMEKRNEEIKQKRIEKLKKEKEDEQLLLEKKQKEEAEKAKKQRTEHLKNLEIERKKRDDERQKKIEQEKAKERRIFVEDISVKYRTKRLQLNALKDWSKILLIRKKFEEISNKFNNKRIKKKTIKSLLLNVKLNQSDRDKMAIVFSHNLIMVHAFKNWKKVVLNTEINEKKLMKIDNFTLMKKYFEFMRAEKKRRRRNRLIEIQNALRVQMLKRVFEAWPVGCAAIRDEEEREETRETLFSKALKFLDEISSDGLD